MAASDQKVDVFNSRRNLGLQESYPYGNIRRLAKRKLECAGGDG
jgi:hypothetical protein